jgi:glutamate racemase
MKNLPIGIFDSGIGGLTVAKAVHDFLPNESLIYFGDTAHLPYGDKSPDLLKKYVTQIVEFLLKSQVKAIIIACNTASAVAYEFLKQKYPDILWFEVIQPAVSEAIQITRNQRIGVIGTKTTIFSHVYLKKILDFLPTAFVVEKATPLLVPMIEEGWFHDKVSKEIIEAYLSDTGFTHIDTLILGCTHYPLIRNEVEQYFNQNSLHKVNVIDSSIALAKQVRDFFTEQNLFNDSSTVYKKFYVSDLTSNFQNTASLFFGEDIVLEKIEHGM